MRPQDRWWRPAWAQRASLSRPRRGLAALAALLLPTLALAFLSIQAVRREALVRQRLVFETHRGIADLVNGRLDTAMAEADRAIAIDVAATDPQPEPLLAKLQAIETSKPWLQPLVLVSPKGVEGPDTLTPSFALTAAESEEHRLKRPALAAVLYSKAALASTGRQRIEALNGQARSELRSGQPARARNTYAMLIAAADTLDPEQARRSLVARYQRLHCDTLLGDRDEYTAHAVDVYRFLIGHRFVLDEDTYDFYARRIVETLAASARDLDPGQTVLVEQLRQHARQLDPVNGSIRNPSGEPGNGGNPVVALISIDRPRARDDGPAFFVAHPWGRENVTALLRRLLSEPGPWSVVGIALLDTDGHAVFSSVAPVPADAARAGTTEGSAHKWRIAAFPASGSLDALVVRDVTRYAQLLVLVFATVVAALGLAARSVSRELTLSRLRADFVASVSHELKTPLSLIRMFAESLREGWVPEDKRADYYQVITRESERLTGLINNVLDLSRIEAGTRKYQLARIDLRALLAEVLGRYRFHLKATNIDLVEDLPAEPVVACVEREAIEQVLINLLTNAMKYMGDADRQPRQVRVSLVGGNGHVSIRVADTGIGISDEQRAHIFERFYRGDNDERVRAVAGSGLGLTLVKHIVEAHDGTIAVESVPNVGSTFEITLPLADAGAES